MSEKKSMPDAPLDDEIDLREILNIIIKRKKIILGIFGISITVIGMSALLQPKMCTVSMIIEPPTLGVTDSGGILQLDSSENLKAKIENEAFNQDIIKALNFNPQVQKIDFRISQPKGSNLIKIALLQRVENGEFGVKILNQLFNEATSHYNQLIMSKVSSVENQINIILNNINIKKNIRKLAEKNITLLEERESVLKDEIKNAKINMDKFTSKENALFDEKNQADGVVVLLYANIAQQTMAYTNLLQNEIANVRVEKERVKTKIENLESEINNISLEVERLSLLKASIRNIGLIQEPQIFVHSIRQNIKKRVLVAGMLGAMFSIFLAFVMEGRIGIGKRNPL
jgi:hypothetical protein